MNQVNEEQMLPDYKGMGITNLMSSLLAATGGSVELKTCPILPPDSLTDRRHIVLLVIDGLGDRWLTAQTGASYMNAHREGALTSVCPSTTASAISTFLTGQPPSTHGLTGWHMWFRELATVLAVLPGRPRFGGPDIDQLGLSLAELLDHRSVFDLLGRKSYVLQPANLADSAYSRAHVGRAEVRPFDGLPQLFSVLAETLQSAQMPSITYAYWPELDSIGHQHGMAGRDAVQHLLSLDAILEGFMERMAGTGITLLVTGDHGHVDIPKDHWIDVAEHTVLSDTLQLPLCGEPRLAYAYVRPGAEQTLKAYVAEHLAHAVKVHAADEAIDAGWFGPGPVHPELRRRIGDYLLLMQADYAIRDRLPHERGRRQIGVHGGFSPTEMLVPLLRMEA